MAPNINTPPNQQRPKVIQTYGKYDSSTVKNQYWLARLPPKLFQVWEEAPEGTLLGHLTFTKGTSAVPKNSSTNTSNNNNKLSSVATAKPVQQKLAIQVKEDTIPSHHSTSDLPLDYTITNLTTKIPTLHPFTRSENNGKIQIHGTISRSCNLQMERTERYREMCKSRLLNAVAGGNSEKRFVKPVQNAELVRSNKSMGIIGSGFGNSIAVFGKKILDAKNEFELYGSVGGGGGKKRKFDDSQSVRSILFELFSQQSYWSVKELIAASGRGEKEIRADLKVIAEAKRTGEFKGLWELKSEFAAGGSATIKSANDG